MGSLSVFDIGFHPYHKTGDIGKEFPVAPYDDWYSTPGVVGVAVALHVTPQLHHQTVVELAGGIAKLSVPSHVL